MEAQVAMEAIDAIEAVFKKHGVTGKDRLDAMSEIGMALALSNRRLAYDHVYQHHLANQLMTRFLMLCHLQDAPTSMPPVLMADDLFLPLAHLSGNN